MSVKSGIFGSFNANSSSCSPQVTPPPFLIKPTLKIFGADPNTSIIEDSTTAFRELKRTMSVIADGYGYEGEKRKNFIK